MSAWTPVNPNSPLMIAWELWKGTEQYANTRKWALHEKHVEGSLWAAFLEGWNQHSVAAAAPLPTAREELEQEYGQDHPWKEFDVWHKDFHKEASAGPIAWPCREPLRCLWRYTRKTGAILNQTGLAAPQPVSGLQRTAGDVIRQFRESGSEDWGELESAINWWAMNEFCPNFMKGESARLREALEQLAQMWERERPAAISRSFVRELREAAALESA